MKTYLQKRSKSYALQFTGDNREEFCKELGIDKVHCQLWVNQDSKGACYLVIFAPFLSLGRIEFGHWVVVGMEDRDYHVLSDAEFKVKYEEMG